MPLFELYRMTKERLDSAKQQNSSTSTEPDNDFVELAWENGQILTQGQSSKTRMSPTSTSLPSHNTKTGDKDIGNGTKIGKFGTEDSVLNGIPMSVPSVEMGLNQDDDMVCWLNYPIDESLQPECCSDFMPGLSGVTGNELSGQNNFASFDKSSYSNQFNREFNIHNDSSLEYGNLLKISSVGGGERTRPKSSAGQLYASSSLQCPTSYPYYRSRVPDSRGRCMKNSNENATFGDLNPISTFRLPGLKMQKLNQRMSTNKPGLMNFSHFTRPFALAKANIQNMSSMPGSGLSRIERMGSKDKSSVASSSNPVDPTPVDTSRGLRKESGSQCQPVAGPSKVDVKPLEPKPPQQTAAAEQSEVRCQDEALKNDKKPSQILGESATNGQLVSEKTVELVVASSSVCLGSSVERASEDDPKHNLKRKHHDTEDSECPSEDVEEESVGVKKTVPTLVGTGSKRSRAAEVHNLSERRRRDRINEKMRALQELIPNCNKVDKASMLDEAIGYLKTLQLQVQIMSMGAGLYMPPMMFQQGMQHMHAAAHVAHYSSLDMGMGMGVGYGMAMPHMSGGSSCYPMVQAPLMHGTQLPGLSFSGPPAMQGMAGSNFQLFGIHGQGEPVSMTHASPLTPLSGGCILKSAMGLNASGVVVPMDNLDAATGSTSKDPVQNVNSQVMQSTGTNSLVNQTSSQCQGTNEGFAQPSGVQESCQAEELNGLGTFNSSGKNDIKSTGAACYD